MYYPTLRILPGADDVAFALATPSNRSCAVKAAAVVCVFALGCSGGPATRIEIKPLAEGEWIVADASPEGAILRPMHSTHQPRRRGTSVPTSLALLEDSLRSVPADTIALTVGDSAIPFLRVRDRDVYIPLHGQPHLVRSPTNPRQYVFEHNDAIWLFTAPDSIRKLTQDDDRQILRGRQREGVAILYWSTHPLWSADGQLISFVTNREAFRAATPGQSLWTVNVSNGAEQALYNTPGVSARTEGTLGAEFVFISSAVPGVFTVHPQTRRVTRLGNGYVAGAHARGEALVINDNGRLIVLRGEAADTLPDPPAGHSWNPDAFISPSAQRIALFSTDNKGDYTLHVFQKNHESVLSAAVPGGPSYGPVWVDDQTIIFAAMRIGGDLTTYRADLR